MKDFRIFPLLLLWFGLSLGIHAQNATGAEHVEEVHVGQSVVALYGPWKFHVGDSPILSGQTPEWAQPGFDDSSWESVSLKPAAGATDPLLGTADYLPGWTGRGHPGVSGFAWYRLHVRVTTRPGQALAIEGSGSVDDGYEIYSNGALLGSFGKFSGRSRPIIFNSQPKMFRLPLLASSQNGTVDYVIAFRLWMEPSTPLMGPDAGGLHNAPVLGDLAAITNLYQLSWMQLTLSYITVPILGVFFLLLALIAFGLFLFDRSDRVYVWLIVAFLPLALTSVTNGLSVWGEVFAGTWNSASMYGIFRPITFLGWTMVWREWFQVRRPAWLPRVLFFIVAVLIVCRVEALLTSSPSLPHVLDPISLLLRLVILSILFYVLIRGIREQKREGWLALLPILLIGLGQFQEELSSLHIPTTWFAFGVGFGLVSIANFLLVLVMLVLLLRRLSRSIQQQKELALEVEHSRELQHVLLPSAEKIPGLQIDWEYRPAREVGGDFFQIIPHATDGSTLVIAGDVAGKGLAAGMLVALLVGAARSTAEMTPEPLAVLEALNRRLLGRGDAHATCLVLRIEKDGLVTLANAGHLAPYVDGAELEMEGSLPLGVVDGVEFPVMRFALAAGSRMVLISDGLPEAQDKDGKLFGFERVREMMAAHRSVGAMADEVQAFGQSDDISVVSVVRA